MIEQTTDGQTARLYDGESDGFFYFFLNARLRKLLDVLWM